LPLCLPVTCSSVLQWLLWYFVCAHSHSRNTQSTCLPGQVSLYLCHPPHSCSKRKRMHAYLGTRACLYAYTSTAATQRERVPVHTSLPHKLHFHSQNTELVCLGTQACLCNFTSTAATQRERVPGHASLPLQLLFHNHNTGKMRTHKIASVPTAAHSHSCNTQSTCLQSHSRTLPQLQYTEHLPTWAGKSNQPLPAVTFLAEPLSLLCVAGSLGGTVSCRCCRGYARSMLTCFDEVHNYFVYAI
jgi:hypothetical protein